MVGTRAFGIIEYARGIAEEAERQPHTQRMLFFNCSGHPDQWPLMETESLTTQKKPVEDRMKWLYVASDLISGLRFIDASAMLRFFFLRMNASVSD
jgi:hypothetical protein